VARISSASHSGTPRGLAAKRVRALSRARRERFLDLARRFKETPDPRESDRLRDQLAQLVFGA
jgi:hypothetical protein